MRGAAHLFEREIILRWATSRIPACAIKNTNFWRISGQRQGSWTLLAGVKAGKWGGEGGKGVRMTELGVETQLWSNVMLLGQ